MVLHNFTVWCTVALMDFKTYFLSLSRPEREAIAVELGTTYGHLRNIAYGDRSMAEILALRLERASSGSLPLIKSHPELAIELSLAGYEKAVT